jgi:hypothetical protein
MTRPALSASTTRSGGQRDREKWRGDAACEGVDRDRREADRSSQAHPAASSERHADHARRRSQSDSKKLNLEAQTKFSNCMAENSNASTIPAIRPKGGYGSLLSTSML